MNVEPALFIVACAILNRARGSRVFGLVESTTGARLFSMGLIGFFASLFFIGQSHLMDVITAWIWATLMIWCVFAWDAYWGMAIGTTTALRAGLAPVDWAISKIWPKTPTPGTRAARLWGLIAMTLRMTLAAPCLAGLSWYLGQSYLPAAGVLLMGLPYYIWGYVPKVPAVMAAELTNGAILGFLILQCMGV